MKAKYRDRCRACGTEIAKGDEIGFRERFILCASCCQIFDNGMTDEERQEAKRQEARANAKAKQRRLAAKAYRQREKARR